MPAGGTVGVQTQPQEIDGVRVAADTVGNLGTVVWGAPTAESGNAREVTGTVERPGGAAIARADVELELRVSDSATDPAASATATLAAAAVPVGTVLTGSGTATMEMRTSAGGQVAVKVTEATAAVTRHLWVRQGRNSTAWIRAAAGPLAVAFT